MIRLALDNFSKTHVYKFNPLTAAEMNQVVRKPKYKFVKALQFAKEDLRFEI